MKKLLIFLFPLSLFCQEQILPLVISELPQAGSVPVIFEIDTEWKDNDNNISLTKGGTFVNDDMALVLAGADMNEVAGQRWANDAISGFDLIQWGGDATSDNQISAYERIIDGTEGATFSVTVDGLAQGTWGALLRLTGVNTTNPIGNVGTVTTTTALSITATGITTANNNSMVVVYLGTDGSDTKYSSLSGTGWKLLNNGNNGEGRIQDPTAGSNSNSNGIWVYIDVTNAGAVPDVTINLTGPGNEGLAINWFEIRSE